MTAPVWTPCTVTLGALKPWALNPRLSSKAAAQRILKSFAKFGQVESIAIGPGNEVYDGHQRLSALLTLHGPDYAIDARRSDRALSDDERRALVLALHMGAVGEWDWQALPAWDSATLTEWGADKDTLRVWNDDALNLRQFLTSEIEGGYDGLPTEDRAPFQQMTFTLHDSQIETVKRALEVSKHMGAFVDSPNENSNGNALARVCEMFVGEHDNG